MNKDLGFFTKHFEKLLLGLAVLAMLAVAAYAWLGVLGEVHPDPGQVKSGIVSAADRVDRNLATADTNLPGPEEYVVPNYAAKFEQQYQQPALDAEAFASRTATGMYDIGDIVLEFDPLFRPTPPVAESFALKFKHGVLADPNAVSDPAFRQFVVDTRALTDTGDSGDFQYVSVMTEFPLRRWAEALDAPEQPATAQIPDNVWFAKLGVTGVYLLREEQLTDGSWGNRTIVDPLPGQPAFLPSDNPVADNAADAALVYDQVQAQQEILAQPVFPPMAFESWTPPTGRDRVLSKDEQAELADLDSKIRNLQRRLDQLTGQDQREQRTRQRPERRRPARDVAGGMDGGMGMGGGGADRGVRRQPTRNAGDREREQQQQQIERTQTELLEARRAKNELLGIEGDENAQGFLASRRGMGMDGMGMGGMGMGGMGMGGMGMGGMGMDGSMGMGGMGMGGMGMDPRNNPRAARDPRVNRGGVGMPQRLTDEVPETLRVWAHDLTVEPGKTYRYKLIVAVINPLYQYTRVPGEQRKANEYALALGPDEQAVESAPWSTPVTLDPEAYFFFVRGNADQDRATIEVWKVYQGLWRKAEFEENPGNPIGDIETIAVAEGFQQPVDMSVGAVLLDIDTVEINNVPQVRMVYLLPDGRIASRVLNDDRRDPKRDQLEIEAEEARDLRAPLAARQ